MAIAPYTVDPDLMAVAIAYRNRRMIADEVMPRVPVNKAPFEFHLWNKEESFTIPDTRVGRTSKPNQVEFSANKTPGACLDYFLDDPIPKSDIDNAPAGIDPRMRATEGLSDLIALDREQRVSTVVFNAASYVAGSKVQLSGTSQISDFVNSKPIGVIQTGIDTPIVRPNTMVFGQASWSTFRRHPNIVKAMHGTAGDTGMATREFVASLFEVEQVLVGEAFLNSARKGQAASFVRVWGKHIALLFIDSLADPVRSASRVTFGFTAQFGSREAGSIPDPDIGGRGGERVRVGESVAEQIVAADVGYFIEDAVA